MRDFLEEHVRELLLPIGQSGGWIDSYFVSALRPAFPIASAS